MVEVQPSNFSLLQRVQDLLRRKPKSYDMVFCVGSAKKEVKAVRILLEAASPVLEKIFEDLEVSGRSIQRIQLPNYDPVAFEVFVKLTMLDMWTTEGVKNCNLLPDQILNLMSICSRFEMENALKELDNLMLTFYAKFADFAESSDFLLLSDKNLQTILSSDNLQINEVDVFRCACRWAKSECAKRKIEINEQNIRIVLGDCLFEIRFPVMTAAELTQCIKQCNILTHEEGFEIYQFIATKKRQKSDVDVAKFSFKTKPRGKGKNGVPKRSRKVLTEKDLAVEDFVAEEPLEKMSKIQNGQSATASGKPVKLPAKRKVKSEVSKLSLKIDSPIVSVPFVCDGSEKTHRIATKLKILVQGFGFLGPIDGDADYDVTVRFENSGCDKSFVHKKIEKRISAQKGKIFHVMFDQPITLNQGAVEMLDGWTNYYDIYYSLKGPKTKSFKRKYGDFTKYDGQNTFRFRYGSDQLLEIWYTNV